MGVQPSMVGPKKKTHTGGGKGSPPGGGFVAFKPTKIIPEHRKAESGKKEVQWFDVKKHQNQLLTQCFSHT